MTLYPKKSFIALPDVCILLIFTYLPLFDLLQMDLVYRHWSSLQQIACSHKRSLALVLGQETYGMNDIRYYFPFLDKLACVSSLFQLQYSVFDVERARWLCSKLPHISTLEITIGYPLSSLTDQVIYLLKNWSTKLASITIHCLPHSPQSEPPYHLYRLLNTIKPNSFPFLRSLIFASSDYLRCIVIDIPILIQLEEFYFSTLDDSKLLVNALVKYAQPNPHLQRIGLRNPTSLQSAFQFTPEFALKFIGFSTHFNYNREKVFNQICFYYSSLTYLRIFIKSEFSFAELASSLCQLAHLETLELIFTFRQTNLLSKDDLIPQWFIPQVRSVRTLILVLLKTTTHLDLKSSHWGWIFPSIEVLKIPNLKVKCSICQLLSVNKDNKNVLQVICDRQLLEPFKQCTKLHRIVIGGPVHRLAKSINDL